MNVTMVVDGQRAIGSNKEKSYFWFMYIVVIQPIE